jgi:hypothetical protein
MHIEGMTMIFETLDNKKRPAKMIAGLLGAAFD